MMSAIDTEAIDATVFVDCGADHIALVEAVAEILDGTTDLHTVWAANSAVLVAANEDADPEQAAERPGGFLSFPWVLEVYASEHAPRRERAAVTALLLTSLWSRGMAAVAACEYEDLLPAGAGTADRSLPWPTPTPDTQQPV